MNVLILLIRMHFYFARKTKSSINVTLSSLLPDIVIRREDSVSLYVDIDCIVYTGHWYVLYYHTKHSRPPSYSFKYSDGDA